MTEKIRKKKYASNASTRNVRSKAIKEMKRVAKGNKDNSRKWILNCAFKIRQTLDNSAWGWPVVYGEITYM